MKSHALPKKVGRRFRHEAMLKPWAKDLIKQKGNQMKQVEEHSERKLAAEITNAIQCITTIPVESLRVTVNEDWVCLRGALNEQHQKEVAEEVVRQFSGVRGVTNLITITPHAASQN